MNTKNITDQDRTQEAEAHSAQEGCAQSQARLGVARGSMKKKVKKMAKGQRKR